MNVEYSIFHKNRNAQAAIKADDCVTHLKNIWTTEYKQRGYEDSHIE